MLHELAGVGSVVPLRTLLSPPKCLPKISACESYSSIIYGRTCSLQLRVFIVRLGKYTTLDPRAMGKGSREVVMGSAHLWGKGMERGGRPLPDNVRALRASALAGYGCRQESMTRTGAESVEPRATGSRMLSE